MIVCLYEDRPTDLAGVKLAILSLARHCPGLKVALTCPAATGEFRAFIARHPQVTLDENAEWVGQGFNVKPLILARLLERHDEVVWLDNDVIVNGDFRQWLTPLTPETVAIAEDPWSYAGGGKERCLAWGLAFGRDLPGPMNTCFLRFTRAHLPLLLAWRNLTRRADYLAAQAKPVYERPVHMLSDQDVITALLASSEFAALPVRMIASGREIIQHHGAGAYTPKWRLRHLFAGFPPLVHAMGVKPWRLKEKATLRDKKGYYTAVYVELSPYVALARAYRAELGEPAPWLNTRTAAGWVCRVGGLFHPALAGLPQSFMHRVLFDAGVLNFEKKRAAEKKAGTTR